MKYRVETKPQRLVVVDIRENDLLFRASLLTLVVDVHGAQHLTWKKRVSESTAIHKFLVSRTEANRRIMYLVDAKIELTALDQNSAEQTLQHRMFSAASRWFQLRVEA